MIRQAMRAMAGGRRDEPAPHAASRSGRGPQWTAVQVLLLAAIVGLIVGMAAAFAVLLTG